MLCGNDALDVGETCDDGDTIADATCDATCHLTCGNGVVDTTLGELCDSAIASGAGACPTQCDDGNACTTQVLNGTGCHATCETTATITQVVAGDGCCPAGANANTDTDCEPDCGNGIIENGEDCDDAGTLPTATCSAECAYRPRAFRIDDLDLRDPHVSILVGACIDFTDAPLAGHSLNGDLAALIQTDAGGDDVLDLSIATVFRPLTPQMPSSPVEIHFPACSTPFASTACHGAASSATALTAVQLGAGTCLGTLPGSTRPYVPAITSATAPCFHTGDADITIPLLGASVPLHYARIGATYVNGQPTTNGVLRGFLTVADATAIVLGAEPLSFLEGRTLASLFPGGAGNCSPHSDIDMVAGVNGWWLYFNFTTREVTWTDD